MSDVIDAFRVQFYALITKIKEDLFREVDVKADALFDLLSQELEKQISDQVVVKNEENNGNAGDDTVLGHVKVEDESIKSECDCDSESEWDTDSDTDEDIEMKKEESEDDDDLGESDAAVNDNESQDLDDDEGDLSIETNQAMSDDDDTVTNTVDDNESAVNQEDGNGDEQTEDAVNGNDAPNNQSAPIPNEPVHQVATTSGLRRSTRTCIKRQQITSDDVTSSDEEDAGSDRIQAGPTRKKSRVNATPVARDRPRQEATVNLEGSKMVITRSLNCTVTECTKEFRDKTQLSEHLKRKHRIDRFPCHIRGCTASFTTKQKLTEHLRSAHGSLTRWQCGHCALQCANYRHLSNHVYHYHELGRFVCGHVGCDFPASTYRKKVLTHQIQHKPATHHCTFTGCGKAFKKSFHLKMHILTHTGERPFVCDHCQKGFTQNYDLTRHVRTQHTHIDERPFVCDLCQRAFNQKAHLTRHVRTQH